MITFDTIQAHRVCDALLTLVVVTDILSDEQRAEVVQYVEFVLSQSNEENAATLLRSFLTYIQTLEN